MISTFLGNRNKRDFAVEPQVKENQKGNQKERLMKVETTQVSCSIE